MIRLIKEGDFAVIKSWWVRAGEVPPTEAMLPPDSTYILEYEGTAFLAVTLYLTNSREFCLVDNFIGNPDMRGPLRKSFTQMLLLYLKTIANALGYQKLFCMAANPKTASYYEELGFTKTVEGITTLTLEI